MDLDSSYEIPRVSEYIRSHKFTRVALQFPDELLKDSMGVLKALRCELDSSVQLFVMADTTFGSCCVDEVGAAHVDADCVIHYGHTCLSRTSELPALYIFGKSSINTSNCARHILNCGLKSNRPVLVLYGLEYAYAKSDIEKALVSNASCLNGSSMLEYIYADVSSAAITPSNTCEATNPLESIDRPIVNDSLAVKTSQNYSIGGLSWRLPQERKVDDYLLFWIGLDNPAFTNAVLTFNNCEIVRYDAEEDCFISDLSPQKILRRRYYLVEKAKDANIIGILVGTLGSAGYLHMVNQFKELIAKAGKKSYTFVMGRPNPAKLANFPECDVFIHVSCAETALLDSKEFLAPIITPFEAILALDRGQWTGEYVTEFQNLIDSDSPIIKKQSEKARFSFFQGGYVEDLDVQENDEVEKDEVLALVNTTEKALQIRDDNTQSLLTKKEAKSGAEYFASRSYHGLDINGSNPLPEKFLTGRSGKASGYTHETFEW